MTIRIGNYECRRLWSGRWEVTRGDMVMAVFLSESEAAGYAQRKHDGERT